MCFKLNYYLTLLCILSTTLSVVNSKITSYVDLKGILHNVTEDRMDGWAAMATFDNSINKTGWAQLEITSNPSLNDSLQAYTSGLIEGYLTSELISFHWSNNIKYYCDNETKYCNKLFAFITKNLNFMKTQIEIHSKTDPYWRQIELSFIQLTGLEDGYKVITEGTKPLGTRIDLKPNGLILLNLMTEFYDLEKVLNKNEFVLDSIDDRCSAIIKVLSDGSDLLVSHNTWSSYRHMLRVLKKYNFNYRDISGKSVAFSSYPGTIFSIDDYYMTSSGLTVLETSIGNYNKSLLQNIIADNMVFEFIRNTVANRLANSGKEWSEVFSKYNSGTYNNQFMIIDFKKFVKGVNPSQLSDGLLWILEQMPGYVESSDVTHVLRQQHYWPSYNVPYFESVYNLSEYGIQYLSLGPFFSYTQSPRALMFKRDQKNVVDLQTLYKLMTYNDFKKDPLSRCMGCSPPYTGEYAIAARCDLNDPNGHYGPNEFLGFRYSGAIDVKMTNSELFSKLEMIATSGPTYDNQPPFQWPNTKLTGVAHDGQPHLFKFPPVHVKWSPASQTPITFKKNN